VLNERPSTQPSSSPEIEEYRDERWHRQNTACIETVTHAEEFIECVGFAACLTDARRPGPSLYIAVCGRRDAVLPRNVQKDPETSHTWMLKDEVMRRGRVHYGKLVRGRATFLAPRMIPYFTTLRGVPRRDEKKRLSGSALRVLRVLRREWEMGTVGVRNEVAPILLQRRPVCLGGSAIYAAQRLDGSVASASCSG
jgi:hypothetical protein